MPNNYYPVEALVLKQCECYIWPMLALASGRCGRCGEAANEVVPHEDASELYARPRPGFRRIR